MNKSVISRSNLYIRDLELTINLGVGADERKKEQTILLDIDILFAEPPKACGSDQLDDTLCYAFLINEIKQKLATRHFHVIEYLSREIYGYIKPYLPSTAKVNVRVIKHPKIEGLKGHVCFEYGDA